MAFEFARQMEREASELAQGFEAAIDGVKPWHSYARLFDGPATRVFVGMGQRPAWRRGGREGIRKSRGSDRPGGGEARRYKKK